MKGDAQFLNALSRSHLATAVVAEAFRQHGCGMRVLPNTVAPSFAQRMEHTDSGDLEITMRMEVKWQGYTFNSVQSYPFPKVLVDEVYKIKKKHALRALAYVLVNASLTGAIIVPMHTRKLWVQEWRFDKSEGGKRLFYFCPKDCPDLRYMAFPHSLLAKVRDEQRGATATQDVA